MKRKGYLMKPPSDDDALPAPNMREARRRATRCAILDAAIDAFAARGFEGTSLPQIASTCGVRVSLILYHFESKRTLWEACVGQIYGAVEAALDAATPQIEAATGIERLRIAVSAHIRAAAAQPAFHRVLFQEAMQKTDRLEWLVEHHQRAMSDRMVVLVDEAKTAGILPRDLPSMHLKFVISGMFALPIALGPEYSLLTNEDPGDQAFIDRHVALCLELLRGRYPNP